MLTDSLMVYANIRNDQSRENTPGTQIPRVSWINRLRADAYRIMEFSYKYITFNICAFLYFILYTSLAAVDTCVQPTL